MQQGFLILPSTANYDCGGGWNLSKYCMSYDGGWAASVEDFYREDECTHSPISQSQIES